MSSVDGVWNVDDRQRWSVIVRELKLVYFVGKDYREQLWLSSLCWTTHEQCEGSGLEFPSHAMILQ